MLSFDCYHVRLSPDIKQTWHLC